MNYRWISETVWRDSPTRLSVGSNHSCHVKNDGNVFSANDIRDFEDLNPIPEADGGEDYHYPINFAIAGQEIPVTNPGPAVPA